MFDCTHLGNLFIAGQRESARHLLQFATARLYFSVSVIVIIIVYIVGIIVVITITMIRTIMKENHLLA